MNNYPLTIELVPETSWFTNVRSNISRSEWDVIRKKCYKKANHKCEICGDIGHFQGFTHKVEAHEIWEFDDKNHTQKLIGLIALCPKCHKTKHVGLASVKGEEKIVIDQLIKVNEMSKAEVVKYIEEAFKLWTERSKIDWKVDISYLDIYK